MRHLSIMIALLAVAGPNLAPNRALGGVIGSSTDVSLESATGQGSAGEAGTLRRMSGISFSLARVLQTSQRWEFAPQVEAGIQMATAAIDEGADHRTAGIEMRNVRAGGRILYRVPKTGDEPVRLFAAGGVGALWGTMLVDRSRSDFYEQYRYEGLHGRVETAGGGVLVPVVEGLKLIGQIRREMYRIDLGGVQATGDVEEVRDGTTLRYARETSPDSLGIGGTINVQVTTLSLGLLMSI